MHLPAVSIVIPVLNRAADLRRCLDSLQRLEYPRELTEIIVVDNGSTDGTPDVARECGARVLVERKRGAAAARNCGIAAARHALIALIDSDCAAEPRWLHELCAPFADPAVAGVGGALLSKPELNLYEEYFERRAILSQQRAMAGLDWLPPFIITANAAYRKDWLLRVDGFDEAFTVPSEDADLAWRVQWAGGKLVYQPQARIIHFHHRGDLAALARVCYAYGVATVWLFKKHHHRLGLHARFTLPMYRLWLAGLLKTPFALLCGRDRFEKSAPALDCLHATMHLSAKWITSLKLGTICL